MKPPDTVAMEIAKRVIPIPQRLKEEMTDEQYRTLREQYEFAVEDAAIAVAHVLTMDRAEIRDEVQEVCALIAESEFSDPRWKNHEERIGAGIWIGATIRKCFGSGAVTNNVTRGRSASAWMKQLAKQAVENLKRSPTKERKDDRRLKARHNAVDR